MAIFNTVPPLAAGSGIEFDGEVISTRAAPRNLLDNSDFLHPINQREQSLYTGACYTIDRWRTWETEAEIALTGNGVAISGGNLTQYLEQTAVEGWKTYTIACEESNGAVHIKSGVLSDGVWGDIMHLSVDNIGLPFAQLAAGHTYIWAAVYEGGYTADTLPGYTSKGIPAELQACQYFFERVNVHELASGVPEMYKRLRFATKRITPTVSWHESNIGNLATEDTENWHITKNDSNGVFGQLVNPQAMAYWYGYADVNADI